MRPLASSFAVRTFLMAGACLKGSLILRSIPQVRPAMSNQKPDEQEDKPLDPVMENVRRKMVRLQLVSAGVMLVMLMVVLGAIVYKLTRPSKADVPQTRRPLPCRARRRVTAIAALPAGFEVSDVALSAARSCSMARSPAEIAGRSSSISPPAASLRMSPSRPN